MEGIFRSVNRALQHLDQIGSIISQPRLRKLCIQLERTDGRTDTFISFRGISLQYQIVVKKNLSDEETKNTAEC